MNEFIITKYFNSKIQYIWYCIIELERHNDRETFHIHTEEGFAGGSLVEDGEEIIQYWLKKKIILRERLTDNNLTWIHITSRLFGGHLSCMRSPSPTPRDPVDTPIGTLPCHKYLQDPACYRVVLVKSISALTK